MANLPPELSEEVLLQSSYHTIILQLRSLPQLISTLGPAFWARKAQSDFDTTPEEFNNPNPIERSLFVKNDDNTVGPATGRLRYLQILSREGVEQGSENFRTIEDCTYQTLSIAPEDDQERLIAYFLNKIKNPELFTFTLAWEGIVRAALEEPDKHRKWFDKVKTLNPIPAFTHTAVNFSAGHGYALRELIQLVMEPVSFDELNMGIAVSGIELVTRPEHNEELAYYVSMGEGFDGYPPLSFPIEYKAKAMVLENYDELTTSIINSVSRIHRPVFWARVLEEALRLKQDHFVAQALDKLPADLNGLIFNLSLATPARTIVHDTITKLFERNPGLVQINPIFFYRREGAPNKAFVAYMVDQGLTDRGVEPLPNLDFLTEGTSIYDLEEEI